MCGIAGFIDKYSKDNHHKEKLSAMIDAIQFRGPDDSGIWFDQPYGVALGHRRLSILDLSPAGHQPMESACGRFTIVFNGEIYNHLHLRKQLIGENKAPQNGWLGHSDTETLLACFTAWGVSKTLQSSVGMFAFAVWDKESHSLILARDRIGEKPLYYGWQGNSFLFGSELKAIRAHPDFSNHIDWHAANTFLRLNYIPSPSTLYQNIFKLQPGTILTLTESDISKKVIPQPISYWSVVQSAINGQDCPFAGSFNDAVDMLEVLVRDAVKMQSMADVSVGAFLSGGIDSSTVVAMMQSFTTSKVTTFSIGMPDLRMDESKHAASVAAYLGTQHIEHIIKPQEMLDLIPRLSEIWDEPFADSSQIPTYLVSHLAKQRVSVALSGDGGDEFFLGYSQYKLFQKLWQSRFLGKLPWKYGLDMIQPLMTGGGAGKYLDNVRSVSEAWQQPNPQMLNRYWFDKYRNHILPLKEQRGLVMSELPILNDAATTAAIWDASTYLPDDILVKVDRAAMSNSLEARAPLLDHRIIEFAHSLPLDYKIKNGVGKRVLREVLYRHVPRSLVDRPKMGFSIPLAEWLRKELKDWVEDILISIPNNSEHFNKAVINQLWKEHLSGQRDHTERIWGIVALKGFVD